MCSSTSTYTHTERKKEKTPHRLHDSVLSFSSKKKALKDSQHLKIYTKIIVKDGFAKKHDCSTWKSWVVKFGYSALLGPISPSVSANPMATQ
jgi:hypothetical protein